MKKQPARLHFSYQHPVFGTASKLAPPTKWEKTIYFWWWAYLKRNAVYLQTCENGGDGPCAGLYRDFGDVRGDDFKAWWSEDGRGARLFAEPRAEDSVRLLNEGEEALSRDEALTISLPLNLPKKTLEAHVKRLLAVHHKGQRGKQYAKQSRARYKVQGQPNVPALAMGLAVWDMRHANPEMPLWEIGDRVPGLLRTQKIKPGDDHHDLTVKKRALAAVVSRYIKRVQSSIDGVKRGDFP